jgi:hypothetical protein
MPETSYGQVELLTEQLPFRCMGGDICGGVYTPLPPKGPDPPVSVAAHRLPAYLQIYVQEMQEDPSYTLAKDFPPIEAHKISTYVETATLREALLDFMLESLHHGRPSLTHHLMGLKECATTLQPSLVFPRDMRGYDETCLSAIMKQLGRDGLCWKVNARGHTCHIHHDPHSHEPCLISHYPPTHPSITYPTRTLPWPKELWSCCIASPHRRSRRHRPATVLVFWSTFGTSLQVKTVPPACPPSTTFLRCSVIIGIPTLYDLVLTPLPPLLHPQVLEPRLGGGHFGPRLLGQSAEWMYVSVPPTGPPEPQESISPLCHGGHPRLLCMGAQAPGTRSARVHAHEQHIESAAVLQCAPPSY